MYAICKQRSRSNFHHRVSNLFFTFRNAEDFFVRGLEESLTRYSQTPSCLHLSIPSRSNVTFQRFPQLVHLKELTIGELAEGYFPHVAKIVEQCVNLESFTFHNVDKVTQIWIYLAGLQKLTHFHCDILSVFS
jgi:hypothetical protein